MLYNQTTKFKDQTTDRQKDKRAGRQAEQSHRLTRWYMMVQDDAYAFASLTAKIDTQI